MSVGNSSAYWSCTRERRICGSLKRGWLTCDEIDLCLVQHAGLIQCGWIIQGNAYNFALPFKHILQPIHVFLKEADPYQQMRENVKINSV